MGWCEKTHPPVSLFQEGGNSAARPRAFSRNPGPASLRAEIRLYRIEGKEKQPDHGWRSVLSPFRRGTALHRSVESWGMAGVHAPVWVNAISRQSISTAFWGQFENFLCGLWPDGRKFQSKFNSHNTFYFLQLYHLGSLCIICNITATSDFDFLWRELNYFVIKK